MCIDVVACIYFDDDDDGDVLIQKVISKFHPREEEKTQEKLKSYKRLRALSERSNWHFSWSAKMGIKDKFISRCCRFIFKFTNALCGTKSNASDLIEFRDLFVTLEFDSMNEVPIRVRVCAQTEPMIVRSVEMKSNCESHFLVFNRR